MESKQAGGAGILPPAVINKFRIYCRSTTGVVELYQPDEETSQEVVVLADSSMLTKSLPADTIRDLPVSPGTTWTGRTRRDLDPQKRSVWKPSVMKFLIRLAIWGGGTNNTANSRNFPFLSLVPPIYRLRLRQIFRRKPVNDMTDLLDVPFQLYADDLKIYNVIETDEDCLKLQRNIDLIQNWARTNNLLLNISKCNVVSYSRRDTIIRFNYSIENSALQRVNEFKDLGVVFDSKLTFRSHVEYVLSKAYKSLGFVIRNGKLFDNPQTLLCLYKTYKVREHSRTGSRKPTSGTGRDEFARVGAKGIKGGTDAILEALGSRFSVHGSRPIPLQQVLANPWRKTEAAGKIVQTELQPYAAADLGFFHEGQRPYASADHISPPVVIP
ncbi:hypothetical protein GEV33_013254 [Tenebrio molitor]|uniref:Reverse transcriptase domain-containing protein n=1 Tax=Tenebrio molitor TaxID=7067 RepID=A0A8J6H958_TENMO|nr:hypothetical protein GEV33_013254 [Tenebrio molitor]